MANDRREIYKGNFDAIINSSLSSIRSSINRHLDKDKGDVTKSSDPHKYIFESTSSINSDELFHELENLVTDSDFEAFKQYVNENEKIKVKLFKYVLKMLQLEGRFIGGSNETITTDNETDDNQQQQQQHVEFIDKKVEASNESNTCIKLSPFDKELDTHGRFVNRTANNYVERTEYTNKIRNYVNDEHNNSPFMILGAAGSGKSALMAYAAKMIKKEIPDSIVIVRFVGISEDSRDSKSIINSIMMQLSLLTTTPTTNNENNDCENIFELKQKLQLQIRKIANENQIKKLVVLIDSIESLPIKDHKLDFVFYELPKNVKFIISTDLNSQEIVQTLRRNVDYSPSNYLKLDDLCLHDAKSMFETLWQRNCSAEIDKKRMDFAKECLKNTNTIHPIHVKLLFESLSKWPDGYEPTDDDITDYTDESKAFLKLLENTEKKFGQVLFSRCIFYLTLFDYLLKGILESDLEDILSIDDDVLDILFKDSHPPQRRFPMESWYNIVDQLEDYLSTRETENDVNVSWLTPLYSKAARKYCNERFKPIEKDKMILNVIDYYIEQYNEKKSNGQVGLKKEFKWSKSKASLDFDKIPGDSNQDKSTFGDFIVYTAFRNTRPQSIKTSGENNERINYNRRKLKILPELIMLLSDKTKKVRSLREYVYFDSDFMTAKAELGEMSFVVGMHDKVVDLAKQINDETKQLELANSETYSISEIDVFKRNPMVHTVRVSADNRNKNASQVLSGSLKSEKKVEKTLDDEAKELVQISENYTNSYLKIQQNPKSLNIDTLKRAKLRSKEFDRFEGTSGSLTFLNSNIKHGSIKSCYINDKNSNICKFFSQKNGPCLFSQVETDDGSNISLNVINTNTLKSIGTLDLRLKARNIRIILNEDGPNNVEKLTDLSGYVFFNSKNSVFISDFSKKSIRIVKQFDGQIEDLFLLSSRSLLVVLRKSMTVLHLQENRFDIESEKVFEEEGIDFVKSNIPDQFVYSAKYFDKVDTKKFIVGLSNKIIKIFQPDLTEGLKKVCETRPINWSLFGYGFWIYTDQVTFKETLIVDKDSMIDSSTGDETSPILRFAIQEKSNVDIIEVNKEGECKITEIACSQFGITEDKDDKFHLESLFDNKILVKLRAKYYDWVISLYDYEKKTYSKIVLRADRINYMEDEGVLYTQRYHYGALEILKIDKDSSRAVEIAKINVQQCGRFNESKHEFLAKNDQLIRIEPLDRLSIQQITYITTRDKENNERSGLTIGSLFDTMAFTNENKVIASVKSDICIIDVNTQISLKNLNGANANKTRLLACNQDYVAYADITDESVHIYGLAGTRALHQLISGNLQFTKLHSTGHISKDYFKKWSTSLNKCFSKGLNRFFITLYNWNKHSMKIIDIEPRTASTGGCFPKKERTTSGWSTKEYEIKMKGIDLDFKRTQCLVTPLDNYLVLWDGKAVYYINIFKKMKTHKRIDIPKYVDRPDDMYLVPNTNDLILNASGDIYYIKFGINYNLFNEKKDLIKLKSYPTNEIFIKLQNDFLVIGMAKERRTELYRLSDVRSLVREICDEEVRVKTLDSIAAAPLVLNEQVRRCCISSNQEYFIAETTNSELCVYKTSNLKRIANVQLNDEISDIVSNGKYISLKCNSKLMSYQINDGEDGAS